jgi:peptidoglycan/LPS O-acetylase OafA/YrhL
MRLCGALIAISLAGRILLWIYWIPRGVIYTWTITRMDALASGAAAAAAVRMPAFGARLTQRPRYLWAVALAALIVGAIVSHRYRLDTFSGSTIGNTFLCVTFACALLAATVAGPRSLLRVGLLRLCGKYSYGMYVFNRLLGDYIGKPLLLRFRFDVAHSWGLAVGYAAIGIVSAFGCAVVSYHLFELPFLRLKKRLAPRST